ncbi:hypothetical protein [Fluviicola sp.]|uniref:hypothetical protein n=1 Tax=Fluviicola sp. TaxID=1917219 RepID=UPI003D2D899E
MKNLKAQIKLATTLGLLIFYITSCYHKEEVDTVLTLRKSKNYRYELQLLVHHEGRGNIHQLDASKYSFEASNWLYFNQDTGKVYAKDLVVTPKRNETDSLYRKFNLKGFVQFSKDSIHIRLITPHYIDQDTIVDEWLDYKYNGSYKLKKAW